MARPHDDPDTPRPMAAGHVIVAVVVALLGGGVLNAQALTEAAARQPFGFARTVSVIAATPFRGVAGLLGLDAPHTILSRAAAGATGVAPPVGSQPDAAADAPVTEEPTPAVDPNAVATRPTETATSRGNPTRKDPLRVWVGGDSLTSEFGPALSDRLARTKRAKADVEFRFSTGLARPDFFNWPGRLRAIAEKDDPDVFVVMFGANDGQNIEVRGEVLAFGSAEWRQEYGRRVDLVMDRLGNEGRSLYWVGQPIMRSPDFDAKMQALNDVYREQARGRDDVEYVDTRQLFSAGGGFAAYLRDGSGTSVLMRQQDGVHLTRAGGERLTTVVYNKIAKRWELPASP